MPHQNDMTHWDEIACQRGHTTHRHQFVEVELGGPTPYADYPPIPDSLTLSMRLAVWVKEPSDGPYCPANDAVSETITQLGVWEVPETIALMDAFRRTPGGIFVDIGAQIGWYSTIATLMGLGVIAYEADPENARLLELNLENHVGMLGAYTIVPERVDSTTTPLGVAFPHRYVVKIDIEGAEEDGVKVLRRAIDEDVVDFLLVEISPVFHDRYPQLVVDLMEHFEARLLPEKCPNPAPFESIADLDRLEGSEGDIREEVASWHQRDVVFVRKGVDL